MVSGDLRADEALRIIDRLSAEKPEFDSAVMYVGDGFLECGICGCLLSGGHFGRDWYPEPSRARYGCVTSHPGRLGARVAEVDGELQKLTRNRLAKPAFVAAWRAARLAELDARIAEGRGVLAWASDERRLAELADAANRQLGVSWLVRGLQRLSGRGGKRQALLNLNQLTDQMTKLINERAALA